MRKKTLILDKIPFRRKCPFYSTELPNDGQKLKRENFKGKFSFAGEYICGYVLF